ncbi:MAG TPA: glutamyl-tRNA reductase [Acidobacteriota bacterium]|nr:glutamyl-tRNA reductase [Acidobacteriota bacterium]
MFNLVLVGLNHRTAKIDTRQKASFDADDLPQELNRLSTMPKIHESMILSTCNRVEILSCVEQHSEGIDTIESFLSEHSSIPLPELQEKLYRYSDEQAVRHLFRVASSLDSMVLGEPQILGQLKSCYNTASDARTVGTHLNRLLQSAFKTAKRVRTETNIGEYPVSVSSAAVELVRKIFGDLQKTRILIVGAGKMGETAIRHLSETGAQSVYVANRSPEAARELAAKFRGTAVPFTELRQWITRADIVITSTGAPETLIGLPMVHSIMHDRKSAPIVFIDISVPRNVDPEIGTIENVFCYDIDDLGAVVEANLHERLRAAAAAEKIVDQEVHAFYAKLKSMDLGPAVIQVQGHIEEICKTELQRYMNKMGFQEPKQVQELEHMISRIAAKIAHPLVMQLRNGQESPSEADYADLIRRLFKTKESD